MSKDKEQQAIDELRRRKQQRQKSGYETAGETMSVNDKLEVLKNLGREDLIDIFKEWKPRKSAARKRGAPLDQRVSITVTDAERRHLDKELAGIKKAGVSTSMSQFIRHRAAGTVDINGWRDIAIESFSKLEDVVEKQVEYRARRRELIELIENEDDEESALVYELERKRIEDDLTLIVAQNERRKNRLSGRMSMTESELIKWRAERLCISTSDFLRLMIFDLEPNSTGDAHMSLDAKRRFYASIIDVANNGWGEPPKIYNCSQCENYMETIRSLKEENRQLRQFG